MSLVKRENRVYPSRTVESTRLRLSRERRIFSVPWRCSPRETTTARSSFKSIAKSTSIRLARLSSSSSASSSFSPTSFINATISFAASFVIIATAAITTRTDIFVHETQNRRLDHVRHQRAFRTARAEGSPRLPIRCDGREFLPGDRIRFVREGNIRSFSSQNIRDRLSCNIFFF